MLCAATGVASFSLSMITVGNIANANAGKPIANTTVLASTLAHGNADNPHGHGNVATELGEWVAQIVFRSATKNFHEQGEWRTPQKEDHKDSIVTVSFRVEGNGDFSTFSDAWCANSSMVPINVVSTLIENGSEVGNSEESRINARKVDEIAPDPGFMLAQLGNTSDPTNEPGQIKPFGCVNPFER